ncbi:hypothetical protein SEA_LUZDEMUNDO_26 [Microbacterium phage LuzDeMundo]|nr:hypothetical protein SEA_LUZDEMUNDO_26 [Microbacterium phage LuzDeMundo]
MGFWDAPTTVLDPATGLPLMGNIMLGPQHINTPGFQVLGRFTSGTGPASTRSYVNGAVGISGSGVFRTTDGNGMMATLPQSGTTANRPTGLTASQNGYVYFDTTLGYVIYWRNPNWVDSTGAVVA